MSFNPCFNGFTSLTTVLERGCVNLNGSFNPCFNGFTSLTFFHQVKSRELISVSILVLMDSLL